MLVFSHSIDRQIAKSKKLYFCDTGLANSLAELSSGAQFENTVFHQLLHLGEVNYFALKSGQEIDFILEGNVAIEAKETPTTDDMTRLERLATRTALSKSRLVGRHKSPTFTNYTWAGSIT